MKLEKYLTAVLLHTYHRSWIWQADSIGQRDVLYALHVEFVNLYHIQSRILASLASGVFLDISVHDFMGHDSVNGLVRLS